MNIRNLLLILGFFTATAGWSQTDTTTKKINEPTYIEEWRITELVERYSENNKGKKIDGFRVQLYSGNRRNANEIRKKAVQSFPDINTTLSYATPDYKIQMGDFRTELEAEKQLQLVRGVFPGAFVVKSEINFPKLSIEEVED